MFENIYTSNRRIINLQDVSNGNNIFDSSSNHEPDVTNKEENSMPIHTGDCYVPCEKIGTCPEEVIPIKLSYKALPSSFDWRKMVTENISYNILISYNIFGILDFLKLI